MLTGFWWGKRVWRLLGRPRRRWEVNNIIDFQGLGQRHGPDSYGSGQGQVAGFCEWTNPFLGSVIS